MCLAVPNSLRALTYIDLPTNLSPDLNQRGCAYKHEPDSIKALSSPLLVGHSIRLCCSVFNRRRSLTFMPSHVKSSMRRNFASVKRYTDMYSNKSEMRCSANHCHYFVFLSKVSGFILERARCVTPRACLTRLAN